MDPMALSRHMKAHASRDLAKAASSANGKAGKSLLDRIQARDAQIQEILAKALDNGSHDVCVSAMQASLRALELEGRVTGEISASGGVNIMLGVRIDVAQRAVEVVRDAQEIAPREVVERALRVIRAWNSACVVEGERVSL